MRETIMTMCRSLYLSAVSNDDLGAGFAAAATKRFHLLDKRHSLHNFAEDNLRNYMNYCFSVVKLGVAVRVCHRASRKGRW
jgi:hypothetical protein